MRPAVFTFLLITVFCGQILSQQDSVKTVIISERVGKEIDRAERDKYKLFTTIPDYRYAVFIVSPDKKFYAKVVYGKEGNQKDTLIAYSRELLLIKAEQINNFELLERGEYIAGSNPAEITIGDELISGRELVREEKPPEANRIFYEPCADCYKLSDFRFLIGIRSQPYNFSSLNELVRNIEDQYRAAGNTIYYKELDLSLPFLFILGIEYRYNKNWSLSFEASFGNKNSSNENPQEINYWGSKLSAKYIYPLSGIVDAVVSAGAIASRVEINKRIMYDNPLNTKTGDLQNYFQYINLVSREAAYGGSLDFAVRIRYEENFNAPFIEFTAGYSFVKNINVQSETGKSGYINYSGFSYGAKIAIISF